MPRIISVYINGTDEPAGIFDNSIFSLANLLHALTVKNNNNLSYCLEGCGIDNSDPRDLSGIFTFYLEKQIDLLATEIKKQLEQEKTTLNLYGFSRGGAGVFWLCQKLKNISRDQLEINVLAFEPVPGNFISGVYADKVLGFGYTLSSIISDLRACQNINNVQVLFTNEPLPDIACHAPILPVMPQGCNLEVDVIPGCHKGSELFYMKNGAVEPVNVNCTIAYHQAVDFLSKCGTKFDFENLPLEFSLKITNKGELLLFYENSANEMSQQGATTRSMHFNNEIYSRPGKNKCLNYFHQKLKGAITFDPANSIMYVKDTNPQPSFQNGHRSLPLAPYLLAGTVSGVYFYWKIPSYSSSEEYNQPTETPSI